MLGSYLSAARVVGVSGVGGGLPGPMEAEMLVEPERGGSGGFSSSPSVDRGQWGICLGLLPSVKYGGIPWQPETSMKKG